MIPATLQRACDARRRVCTVARFVSRLRKLALAASALALAGCAGFTSERHLAPFYTELSTAGGGKEIEAAGGALRLRYVRPDGGLTQWALRPLVIHDELPGDDSQTRFLMPFGSEDKRGDEYVWQLLPITRYSHRTLQDGNTEWTLLTLPGIYWAKTSDGRIVRAWFPFGGVMEHFLSFDRLVFVMFPLFMKTERDGRTSYHFLFPIFAFAHGAGGTSWRVWPIYGNSRWKGRYDRWFLFWPFWTFEHNLLDLPPDKQETRWMLFPLVGHATHDTYHSTTVLWPFFGYSRDPQTGFIGWDAPWPIVRYLRDPENNIERTRFWPFYSHYNGDGLDSTSYLWPLFTVRSETYEKAQKNSIYMLPFWQSWTRNDREAGFSSFERFWPLYLHDRPEEHTTRFAFPALSPLWRTPEIDDMYAWIWEVYVRETNHAQLSERSWLGLYRRERDEVEDRRSLAGLWAHRRYHAGGERISETSLLFGLLRWRTRERGSLEWLPPALPGPGWPLQRARDTAH